MKKLFLFVAFALCSALSFGGTIRFEKITDASSLQANDSVIMVCENLKVANGAASGKQLDSVNIVINSAGEVEMDEEKAKSAYLRLIKSGSYWKVMRGNKYMRIKNNSSSSVNTDLNFDTSAGGTTYTYEWSISFSGNDVLFAPNSSKVYGNYEFRYNSDATANYFRPYKLSGGTRYGEAVQLYRRIKSQATSVTSVELNKDELLKRVDDAAETLTATVKPSNATVKTVTWGSTNTGVATVNNGTVSFMGAGTAKVWVKTTDGDKTDTCYVTVRPKLNTEEATFKAVQKADYLPEGAKVFFGTIKDGENYVMGLYASGDNNIKGVSATYGTNRHDVKAQLAYAYTVEKDGNNYLFKDQDGNYLRTISASKLGSGVKDDYAKWTLGTFDEDDATVILTNAKSTSSSIYNNFQGTNEIFNVYSSPDASYAAKTVLYSDKAEDWVEREKNPTMVASGDALSTVDGKLTLDWGQQEPDPYVSGDTNPWGDSRKFTITVNDLSDDVEVTLTDLTGTFYCGWVSSGIKKDRTTPAEITVFWEAASKGMYTATLKFHTETAGVDDIEVILKAEAVEESGSGVTPELFDLSADHIYLNPTTDASTQGTDTYRGAEYTFKFSARNLAKALRLKWWYDTSIYGSQMFPWSIEQMNVYLAYQPLNLIYEELAPNQRQDLGTDDITDFEVYICLSGIQNHGTYKSELQFESYAANSHSELAIDVKIPITVYVSPLPTPEGAATGMEGIQESEISSQKIIRNGQMLIIRNSEVYSVTGLKIND